MEKHATYIDWNQGPDSWQDMMLMTRCRHHIICNSTLSWWGSWLNSQNGGFVVCPDRWYAGNHGQVPLYLAEWCA